MALLSNHMAIFAPRVVGASWSAVLVGSRCRSQLAGVMGDPGGAGGAGAEGESGPPPPGDLRSVLITSVLNLERLEVDLFRCAWTPGQRDRAGSSAAALTAGTFSPQGPASLGARHAAPLRRADRGAGAGGGSACREPRRAGALAALLLRADRCARGTGQRGRGAGVREGPGSAWDAREVRRSEEAPSSRFQQNRDAVGGTAGRGPCRAGFVCAWCAVAQRQNVPFLSQGTPRCRCCTRWSGPVLGRVSLFVL